MSRSKQSKSGSSGRTRHRPPRRSNHDAGIDKNAERLRVEAVLDRLAPRFSELAEEAMAKRDDHVLYVLDPHSVLLRAMNGEEDVLAPLRERMRHDTGVTVFPVELMVRQVQMIADMFPQFASLIEQIRKPPPDGYVRRFIQIWHSFQLDHVTFTTADTGHFTESDVQRLIDKYMPDVHNDPTRARFCQRRKRWFYHPSIIDELERCIEVEAQLN